MTTVPSSQTFTLGEPSLADLIHIIAEATDLAPDRKRYWTTSIKQMALHLGRPPETMPARMTALSGAIARLHPDRLGVNAKTFANHRANLRAALVWFARGAGALIRPPLAAPYPELLACLASRHDRDMLSPFLRFLSKEKIAAEDVQDAHLEAYAAETSQLRFRTLRRHHLRRIARLWNRIGGLQEGITLPHLTEPRRKDPSSGCDLAAMPEGLRADLERYLALIGTRHRTADGRIMRACAASTVTMRRRELEAVIRMAVASGIRLSSLTSLADLIRPATAQAILDAYWQHNGETPSAFTIELAGRFVAIDHLMDLLTPDERIALRAMRSTLETYRQTGLTPKNREVVRAVLASDVWGRVVLLPARMMAEAEARLGTAPVRAAVLAAVAVAIRMLVVAPIRMQNLAAIRLDVNLVGPGGPGVPYLLVFPETAVKNRQALEIPLDPETSRLIDVFVQNFRHRLMNGHNHDWLFPGNAGAAKDTQTLAEQITRTMAKRVGRRVTPHQFRHIAGAIYLRHHPGAYEDVRRILGHKSLKTTLNFYLGLENIDANRRFTALVTSIVDASANDRRLL